MQVIKNAIFFYKKALQLSTVRSATAGGYLGYLVALVSSQPAVFAA